jgi:hypothetical protein
MFLESIIYRLRNTLNGNRPSWSFDLIPNVHTGQPEPGAVNISSEGWRLTLVTAPEDVVQPHGDYIHLAVVRTFVFCRRCAQRATVVVTDQP